MQALKNIILFFIFIAFQQPFFASDRPAYTSNPFSFRVEDESGDWASTFMAVDLNNDGLFDYLFRSPTHMYAYSHNGVQMWKAEIARPGYNTGAKQGAADIYGTGSVKVAALNNNNQIVIFDGATGNPEKTISLSINDATKFLSHIALVNLRGLGDREAIVQTADIIPENEGYQYYTNRTLIAVNLESGSEIWRVEQNRDFPEGWGYAFYPGYWGVAHGPFFAADVNGDGRDEVIGGNLIDHEGKIIRLYYPRNWLAVRMDGPLEDQMLNHLDCIAVGNFNPENPGLEWVLTEEGHVGGSWNTAMMFYNEDNIQESRLWRRETNLLASGPQREPQNAAVGNFYSNRIYVQVWNRSRLGNTDVSQHPWLYDFQGYDLIENSTHVGYYTTEDVLPSDFQTHHAGAKRGLEFIWTIDWFGTKKEYIAAKARSIDGNIGIFDAFNGDAVWYTPRDYPQLNAATIYVADVAGDSREEIIVSDLTAGGVYVRVFSNQEENTNQPKPDKWEDPLYRRLKQNYNYYSPGSYTTPLYPVISNIQITDVDPQSVIVSWNTDIASYSRVEYGTTDAYGNAVEDTDEYRVNHSLLIDGLEPDTQYHYRIVSLSAHNQTGISRDRVFSTNLPNKLVFTTPSRSAWAGTVTEVITVELQNNSGESSPANNNITVMLNSSSGQGRFSLNAYPWEDISSVVIEAGTSEADFYYKDTAAGNPVISLQENPDISLEKNNQQQTIGNNGTHHRAHLVYGVIRGSSGAYPSFQNLAFEAYMENRTSDILGLSSRACGYNAANGVWWIECANFTNGWQSGETLNVFARDTGSGERAALQLIMNSESSQNAGTITLFLDAPQITLVEIVNGSQARLVWNETEGASGYHIYRSTVPGFSAGQETRAVSSISGLEWTDASITAGTGNAKYFYRISAVNNNGESGLSQAAAVIDIPLETAHSPNIDLFPLSLNSYSPAISTASDLLSAIDHCVSVYTWDAAEQKYIQYYPPVPANNFSVHAGNVYYASVTQNTVFTLAGAYVQPDFSLITTSATDFNTIYIPYDSTAIVNASQLANSLGSCNSVARWDVQLQRYEQYVSMLEFTDFNVAPGKAYLVNITKNMSWPGTSLPKSAAANQISGKRNVPHLAWGRYENDSEQPDFQFTAYLSGRKSEVLTEKSQAVLIGGGFWSVQCADLPEGWAPGDTLIVEMWRSGDHHKQSRHVVLSGQPADSAEIFHFEKETFLPENFAMGQNFPNPFNNSTLIPFELPAASDVSLRVFNIRGQCVRILADQYMEPGFHSVFWDGRGDDGRNLPSGVYLIHMQAGSFAAFGKMMLLQ